MTQYAALLFQVPDNYEEVGREKTDVRNNFTFEVSDENKKKDVDVVAVVFVYKFEQFHARR